MQQQRQQFVCHDEAPGLHEQDAQKAVIYHRQTDYIAANKVSIQCGYVYRPRNMFLCNCTLFSGTSSKKKTKQSPLILNVINLSQLVFLMIFAFHLLIV